MSHRQSKSTGQDGRFGSYTPIGAEIYAGRHFPAFHGMRPRQPGEKTLSVTIAGNRPAHTEQVFHDISAHETPDDSRGCFLRAEAEQINRAAILEKLFDAGRPRINHRHPRQTPYVQSQDWQLLRARLPGPEPTTGPE